MSEYFQVPLSPIHESDLELPTTNNLHPQSFGPHPPNLASIGHQSRLKTSFTYSTNGDDTYSHEAIEVQDIEVTITDTTINSNF